SRVRFVAEIAISASLLFIAFPQISSANQTCSVNGTSDGQCLPPGDPSCQCNPALRDPGCQPDASGGFALADCCFSPSHAAQSNPGECPGNCTDQNDACSLGPSCCSPPPPPPPPPACNNDGHCDPGENATSCSHDCFCGNGTCDSGENYQNCPTDNC